ncbi:hypothetical protein CANCADRAFT_31390 [Tortispora caseinolytica NRRL Y-17796]|uniref:Mei2-like C-terminal RNA recognition motif domain-containing protein n=1 Tax=Tortispora caseinolytica NRRL Y-17796 TaxID=767744 RepID=A0A1E4TF67_9ASCO|nr:hypothetical protein CANCADRAFT_31390 [Tortispora caseinolytica NRRL Y-17796]
MDRPEDNLRPLPLFKDSTNTTYAPSNIWSGGSASRRLELPSWSCQPSRTLYVTGIPKNIDPIAIVDFFQTGGDMNGFYGRDVSLSGTILVSYFDLSDSIRMFTRLKSEDLFGVSVSPCFCPRQKIKQIIPGGREMHLVLINPAEIRIVVEHYTAGFNLTLAELLATIGSVRTFHETNSDSVTSEFVCEFFDVRSAVFALKALNNSTVNNCKLTVFYYEEPKDSSTMSDTNDTALFEDIQDVNNTAATQLPQLTFSKSTISTVPSITKSTMSSTYAAFASSAIKEENTDEWPSTASHDELSRAIPEIPISIKRLFGENVNPADALLTNTITSSIFERPSQVYSEDTNAPPPSLVTMADVPAANKVDLECIANGIETRTTLMLRNIPNKVDQQMLKDYLDVTNKNTYDFLYLRIDFTNRCNVGYAFVNFISARHIITFCQARVSTRWNRFNSSKICDVSFANVQGYEQLVEKFRNSSVMDRPAEYCPKLYYTTGQNQGLERPFPPPNDMRRKMRSITNANMFGMFHGGSSKSRKNH